MLGALEGAHPAVGLVPDSDVLQLGVLRLCRVMPWSSMMMVCTSLLRCDRSFSSFGGLSSMITAAQLRAARALLGIDQQTLAELAGVSLPTIQRMEASAGNVRGVIDTLTKVVGALDRAGIELIGEGARSDGGGRGVRLQHPDQQRRAASTTGEDRRKVSSAKRGRN